MLPSIAVVVLDTLRADAFAEDFDWLPGHHYEQAYSTSHWTIPAHGSLFTGRLPRETGTYAGHPSFDPPFDSLPKLLRDAGYVTRLYTANIHLLHWDGWTADFDEVVPSDELFDWKDAVDDARLSRPLLYPEVVFRCLLSDAPTFRSLKEGVRRFQDGPAWTANSLYESFRDRDRVGAPEFAFFNLMGAHTPYWITDEHRPPDVMNADTGQAIAGKVTNFDAVRDSYRGACRMLSDRYRRLFDTLDDEFDLIITCSDHGELLGEYGLWGHGFGLYPELLRVPLAVSGDIGDLPKDQIVDDSLVSLLDVPSTVAEAAGVELGGRGQSLLDDEARSRVLTERLGQPHYHRNMFKRLGILDRFDEFDIPLRGVAYDAGAYAYEDRTGVETTASWEREAPERVIKDAFGGIERYEKDDGMEASEDVKARLRELGYA